MYKLMIVEDEKFERDSWKFLINKYYHDDIEVVYECDNGSKAVEAAINIKPDIVLLDIHMPKLNGLDAASLIKESLPDTIIIILTANNYFEYAQKAIKIGVENFLVKPYSIKTFKEAIDEVIVKLDKRKVKIEERNLMEKRLMGINDIVERELILDIVNCNAIDRENINNYLYLLKIPTMPFKCLIYKISNIKNIDLVFNKIRRRLGGFSKYIIGNTYKDRLIFYIFFKSIDRSNIEYVSYDINDKNSNISNEFTIIKYGESNIYYQLSEIKDAYLEANRGIDDKHSSVIDKAIEYIDNYYMENITLNTVSDHIGLSKFHLSKLFKKELNINFKDYLIGIRINEAKKLLELRSYNISEVSNAVGYTDPNYFSYAFKKEVGMSPKQYIRSLK